MEASPHIADACEEIVVMNGFGKDVKVINKDVRHVSAIQKPNEMEPEMDKKADILVLEVFSTTLHSSVFLQIGNHRQLEPRFFLSTAVLNLTDLSWLMNLIFCYISELMQNNKVTVSCLL